LFSRRLVEENALAASSRFDLLDNDAKGIVAKQADELLSSSAAKLHASLKKCLLAGIGYHHAGLLPSAKKLVEGLFVQGLLPVVFCTETFALGVNYPARAVVVGQVTKRDDGGFRALTNRELLQMAGRAGRRGQDRRGYVYICVDPSYPEEVPTRPPKEPEPVRPANGHTPESVLRLISGLGPDRDRLKKYVTKSFAAYAAEEMKEEARTRWETVRRDVENAFREEGCPDHERCLRLWKRHRSLKSTISSLKNDLNQKRSALKKARKKNIPTYEKEQAVQECSRSIAEKEAELESLFQNAGCGKGGPMRCPVFAGLKKTIEKLESLYGRYERLPGAEKVSWDSFVQDVGSLVSAGYLTPGWTLTAKGVLALDAGPGGILLAEILDRLAKNSFDVVEPESLAGLAAGCLCENEEDSTRMAGIIRDALVYLQEHGVEKLFSVDMQDAVSDWACGGPIERCARIIDAGPGDFVMLARRAAESLRGLADSAACPEQIRKAAHRAYKAVWRGEVAEVF
jgi:superfamily II RNA helicase